MKLRNRVKKKLRITRPRVITVKDYWGNKINVLIVRESILLIANEMNDETTQKIEIKEI